MAKEVVKDFNEARDALMEKTVPNFSVKKRPASSSAGKPAKVHKRPASNEGRKIAEKDVLRLAEDKEGEAEQEKAESEAAEEEAAESEAAAQDGQESASPDGAEDVVSQEGQVQDKDKGGEPPPWLQQAEAELCAGPSSKWL